MELECTRWGCEGADGDVEKQCRICHPSFHRGRFAGADIKPQLPASRLLKSIMKASSCKLFCVHHD